MKKIGIITLTRNANYGNVLQNIAMQRVIKTFGFEAETIINMTNSSLFGNQRRSLKSILKWVINHNNERKNNIKTLIFRRFCKENVKYSSAKYLNGSFIRNGTDLSDYEYFIVGSDQVWNPMFGFASDFEFLTFAPKYKRLSYAASFGISDLSLLSEDVRDSMIKKINELAAVSVREKSGKEFIDKCCNVECHIHIDPTLLLTQVQWENISKKPHKKVPSNYIFIYMLGDINPMYRAVIEKIAKENEAEIIDTKQKKWSRIDPAEFVWLISNAKCVCTDSFHATVFSILFHRRFYVFQRIDSHPKQETRIESLCDTVGISINQVMVTSKEVVSDNSEIDWSSVEKNLAIEREIAYNFLRNILII